MYKFFLFFLFVSFTRLGLAQEDTTCVSLLFFGDVMGHSPQINAAYVDSTKSYDYDSSFHYIKPLLSEADISIGNLEVTLGITPYDGYPRFSSPAALAVALQKAGVDILATSNNHSNDRGKKGVENTIKILDTLGTVHTGTFKDSYSRDYTYPLIINKKGIRIALLNYTYGTNGLPTRAPNIVNLIDTTQIYYDLVKAKAHSPDKIIVFYHWGLEYQSLPSKDQKTVAQFAFKNGADYVIGAHPHVIQPFERTTDSLGKENLLVYSLGNFISNQRKLKTDGGAMVKFEICKCEEESWLGEAGYFLTWVYRPRENGKSQYYLMPVSQYEHKADFFKQGQSSAFKTYAEQSRKLLNKHNISMPEYVFDTTTVSWKLQPEVKTE
ncbi:CapA family protein [Flammeovirgaceae bacterium SG7u.111]|nr:CapA family protein [Flammeovirgaceae bacterium SG7u.132]WPO38259.1 CapA family protein [Flammeovirgaceae bacterium SG7u.111]